MPFMNQMPPPGRTGGFQVPGGTGGFQAPGGTGGFQPPGPGPSPWLLPEPPSPSGIPLRPLSVPEILNGAFTLIRRSPVGTLGACLVTLTTDLVAIALMVLGIVRTHNGWLLLPGMLLIWPFSAIMLAIVTAVAGRGILGRKIGLWQAIPLARPGLAVLTALPLGLGYVVIWALAAWSAFPPLVLGVALLSAWLSVMLSMSLPAAVLEGRPPHRAWARSWRLVQGKFWRTFGLFMLLGVVSYGFYFAMVLPLEIILMSVGVPIVTSDPAHARVALVIAGCVLAVFLLAVYSVVTAIALCAVTLAFADLRMRKEGFDLMLLRAGGSPVTGDEFGPGFLAAAAPGAPA